MKIALISMSLLAVLCMSGCDKAAFLNEKPNQSLVVPATLADYQAILDRDQDMNGMGNASARGPIPNLGEMGADNYVVLDANFTTFDPQLQNYYTWAKAVYAGSIVYDWVRPYLAIFNCNVVLDGINKLNVSAQEKEDYNRIKGSALFFRAHAYYQLAQVFAPPYQGSTANTQSGLPLRLSSDIGEKLTRANLEVTYQQVLSDLLMAKALLPLNVPFKTRPSKQASYGLLSRVYQTMQYYDKALLYADSCLQIKGELVDYNTLNTAASYPFASGTAANTEVVFACDMAHPITNSPLYPSISYIDRSLYDSYNAQDLRKQVFFRSYPLGYRYKGSYEGTSFYFAGIATDEMFLIRAECLIRTGKIAEGLQDLNLLMTNRWIKVNGTSTFVPYSTSNPEEALQMVLNERRKELIFRALCWTDLRRLNLEGGNISLSRTVNGAAYSLPANDPRWTLPIPNEVISFNPDMAQNIR